MNALKDVHIVIAGTDADTTALGFQLVNQGAKVQTRGCGDVTPDFILKEEVDIVILNHLKDDEVCSNLTNLVKNEDKSRVVPLLAVLDESISDAQTDLLTGVDDYMTLTEHIDSITQKINAVLTKNKVFASSTAIDITPEKTEVFSTGVRVYVVEDDPLLRNLLSIKLTKSSFPSEFSSNGEGAIEEMKRFKPDTIILDLMLPGISGFDILKNIKADADLAKVPVIVFSNKDGSEDRLKARELGADCFYVKAMTDLSELVEQIESLVLNRK
jgi:DNA-binding response OmpR family regulator